MARFFLSGKEGAGGIPVIFLREFPNLPHHIPLLQSVFGTGATRGVYYITTTLRTGSFDNEKFTTKMDISLNLKPYTNLLQDLDEVPRENNYRTPCE